MPGQPSPFRGDVWDTRLPSPAGLHPAVVMSRDVRALSSVIVAVITGTAGPPGTHVLCDPDDGLTGYDVSYVNVTDLHAVDKARLQRFRGRLHVAALRRVEIALHDYLSFPCTGPERLP